MSNKNTHFSDEEYFMSEQYIKLQSILIEFVDCYKKAKISIIT